MISKKSAWLVIGVIYLTALSGISATDSWQYVGVYAPIVYFNTLIVDVFPQGFPGDYSGTCVYADVKYKRGEYVFRYWFYYRYDIRINRYVDQVLKHILEEINAHTINSKELRRKIHELFHEHDWELVEVYVQRLGEQPTLVTYHAHGSSHSLKPDGLPPFNAPLEGTHPAIKVISDMHGSYPAGAWVPELTGWLNWGVLTEFALVQAWEHLMGYSPELGFAPPYKRIDFSYLCRPFSDQMKRIHRLPGYPHLMPWDRD